MRHATILAALAALLTVRAHAAPGDAEAQSKLDACAGKTDAVARLACFDDAFKPGQAAAAAPSPAPPAPSSGSAGVQQFASPSAPPSPAAGQPVPPAPAPAPASPTPRASGEPSLSIPDNQQGWLQRSGTSPMDKSPIEVALLPASRINMSRMVPGMPQHAALVVRCREHVTDLYVAFSDIVDGMEPPIRVSFRIGSGGQPQTGQWQISQDRQSYGFWHTPQTIPMLKELAAADELFVRSDAGSMGTAEASFKLAGMEQALAPLRQACNW